MKKHILILSTILLILLSACANSKPTQTVPSLSAAKSPTPSVTVELNPTSKPDLILEYSEYSLDLELDYDGKTARVHETIRFQNHAGEELNELVLAVEPNLWENCFSLDEVIVDGEIFTSYELDGQRLIIRKNLAPMQIVELGISFNLSIPRIEIDDKALIIRTQVFGYTSRQVNLVDWFPFIVPYINGDGWLLNEPATYGEHLAYETANFVVTVRIKGENQSIVAASGKLIDSTDGLKYSLLKGRNFALSFSPDYLVETREVGDVEVVSYYFAGNQLAGLAALDATVRALEVFNQVFVPYKHSTLSIVQEETGFSMEYDGLYFLERPLYYGYSDQSDFILPTIAAHETAHQWWFGLVGTDQANQPWLDEALATYSERLFNESLDLERAILWDAWRLDLPDNNHCPIDISIYGFYDFGCFYTESVYTRGGLFMQSLRNLIGDEAFLAFLKDLSSRFSHKVATSNDFFTVLREHTDADLSGILKEFFKGSY